MSLEREEQKLDMMPLIVNPIFYLTSFLRKNHHSRENPTKNSLKKSKLTSLTVRYSNLDHNNEPVKSKLN